MKFCKASRKYLKIYLILIVQWWWWRVGQNNFYVEREGTNQLRWSFERRDDRVWRSNCSDSFLLSADERVGHLVRYPESRHKKRCETVIKSFRSDLITRFRGDNVASRVAQSDSGGANLRRARKKSPIDKKRVFFARQANAMRVFTGVFFWAEITAAEKEQRTRSVVHKKLRNYKSFTTMLQILSEL